MKIEMDQEAFRCLMMKQMFCSVCEQRTCDSCFVPEFARFLGRMDDYETCILCRGVTPYRLRDPVQDRLYYVEGAGQMCLSCFLREGDST
ncbi:MAG TPA: hypothetical protein VJ824_09725 [Bacillota bacterium]|nr:hypothetical protein [Bacillota bacterium]